MKIGVVQITSVLEPGVNLKKIDAFIKEVKRLGAEAVFLPEVFYSMSNGQEPTPYIVEKDNEHYRNIQKLAADNNIYLLGGTATTRSSTSKKVLNRCYNFSPMADELVHYDKMHLFSVDLSRHESSTVIDESLVYEKGNEPKLLPLAADDEQWIIGLSVCFDLRFPELYRYYFSQGANLLTISSAFTVPTGKAHWETLIRARAIENQSYVVAANQWGVHNQKIKTYGHSLVVDPWGEVLCDLGEREACAVVDIKISNIEKVRSRLNVAQQFNLNTK